MTREACLLVPVWVNTGRDRVSVCVLEVCHGRAIRLS